MQAPGTDEISKADQPLWPPGRRPDQLEMRGAGHADGRGVGLRARRGGVAWLCAGRR